MDFEYLLFTKLALLVPIQLRQKEHPKTICLLAGSKITDSINCNWQKETMFS